MTNIAFRFPVSGRKVFPEAVFRLKNESKTVYLTFDDGPSETGTEELINVLKSKGVDKAVFFCEGSNIEKYPAQTEMLRKASYSLANHGFYHLDGWKTSLKRYIDNCEKGSVICDSKFFRPPYGHIKPNQYRVLKDRVKIIFWDLLLYDWDYSIEPEYIISRADDLIRPGSIIALHDKENRCALRVLDEIIDICERKGYDFGDLTEMTDI